jgi:hypothetical protein
VCVTRRPIQREKKGIVEEGNKLGETGSRGSTRDNGKQGIKGKMDGFELRRASKNAVDGWMKDLKRKSVP